MRVKIDESIWETTKKSARESTLVFALRTGNKKNCTSYCMEQNCSKCPSLIPSNFRCKHMVPCCTVCQADRCIYSGNHHTWIPIRMPFLGRRKPVDIKALRKASSALAPKQATCRETRPRLGPGNKHIAIGGKSTPVQALEESMERKFSENCCASEMRFI